MRSTRSVVLAALVITVFLDSAIGRARSTMESNEPAHTERTEVQVTLSANLSTTSWDERDCDRTRFELPLLVLHRERAPATASDRMLEIGITGLPASSEVLLGATPWQQDMQVNMGCTITRSLVLPNRPCTTAAPCYVQWIFDPQTTLSGLYTCHLWNSKGDLLWENSDEGRPDFVMLDTWDTHLDNTTIRIWYATHFTFARGENDLGNRLSPAEVVDYIEQQFVPTIRDTWHTQFHTWGFGEPMHPDWDADGVVEIIITEPPFALFGGTGTYSQLIGQDGVPTRHARIWWFASNNSFYTYRSLEAATRAIFVHEFFHLAQRNVLLATPHPEARWMNVFIEAQGKLAGSIQYPEMELGRRGIEARQKSEYSRTANRYLQHRLNASYQEMESDMVHRYDAILYWRFLYERYGDMSIIRTALAEMTHQESDDIVSAMPTVMDRTFDAVAGPFNSFEESLIAFAVANYSLRLRSNPCKGGDATQCEGASYQHATAYYDPPLEAKLDYSGATLTYQGAIPASYGMDFLEIHIDPALQSRPLTVSVQAEGSSARFGVLVWRVDFPCPGTDTEDNEHIPAIHLAIRGQERAKPYTLTPIPEMIEETEGLHTRSFFPSESEAFNRLALIIVRLDPHETDDPIGAYHVTVRRD